MSIFFKFSSTINTLISGENHPIWFSYTILKPLKLSELGTQVEFTPIKYKSELWHEFKDLKKGFEQI